MNISVSQAANEWGVSRTTIYQKIKDGELSRGSDKKIDTAEMFRVFGEPKPTEQKTERTEQDKKTVQSTAVNTQNTVQSVLTISEETHLLALEKLKNEHLTQQIADQKKLIEQYQQQITQLNKNLEQANASIHELAQTRRLELKQQQNNRDQLKAENATDTAANHEAADRALFETKTAEMVSLSPLITPPPVDTAKTPLNTYPKPKKSWWPFR